MVLKASSGAAIFGRDMLFNIPYIADWNKFGDYRQCQIDLNTTHENNSQIDYNYKVGGKVLVQKDGILCKTETGMTVNHGQSRLHTNGTIRVEHRSKSERLNIR
jgi:hypothetical protein